MLNDLRVFHRNSEVWCSLCGPEEAPVGFLAVCKLWLWSKCLESEVCPDFHVEEEQPFISLLSPEETLVEVPFPLAVILCLGVLIRLRTYQLLQHGSLLSSLLLFSPALTFFFFSPHKTRTACALHVTVVFEGNGLVYGNSVGEEFWNCHQFWLWSSCLGSTLNNLENGQLRDRLETLLCITILLPGLLPEAF